MVIDSAVWGQKGAKILNEPDWKKVGSYTRGVDILPFDVTV